MKTAQKNFTVPLFLLLLFGIFFASCSPTIYYLGDSYDPSDQVDIYYDEADVKIDFKTIGQLTHDKIVNYRMEKVKNEMIKKAKESGADAIVFIDTAVERENELDGDRLSIKAKLIKYLE